jgi:hypothetical protein
MPTMQPTTLTFHADTLLALADHDATHALFALAEDEEADPGERLRALQLLGVDRFTGQHSPLMGGLFSRVREAAFRQVLQVSSTLAAEECFEVLWHTSTAFVIAVQTWDVHLVEIARESALRAFAAGLGWSDEDLDTGHVAWLLAEAGFVATPELVESMRQLAHEHRLEEAGHAAGEGFDRGVVW